MANISKSLLDAISIIANRTADEVSSDKTIKGIVKKIVSTSEGKYLISYNNGDFYAYLQDGSTDLYQIGEEIYILIPEGNMSNKKFILGKVKDDEERSSSKILQSSLLNDYVLVGDNAVIENKYRQQGQAYVKKMQPLSLDSHAVSDFYYCYLRDPAKVDGLPKKNNKYIYDTIDYPSVDIDEEAFNNSAKTAEALLIRAKFKTSLDTDQVGNYGIIVNIAFEDKTNPQIDENGENTYLPKIIAYTLDTSKMTGNPEKFYDYTSQYTITNFDGANYLYIDSIIAFSEGFVNNNTKKHNTDDDVNIYIDKIEISALNEISAINGDYKLKLTTPNGNTVKVGRKDKIKVVAETKYLDKDITKNTIFYWGVKDPSITSSSTEYKAKLGSGYREIKPEDKNQNILSLTPGDLTAAENIFVCVGVYESNIILKTSISVYNNNNKLDITIESDQGNSFQFNEGNPLLTCLINGKTDNYQESYPDEAFTFIWSKEDVEFGTVLLDKTEEQLIKLKEEEMKECQESPDGISNSGRTITQVLSYYTTRIAQVQDITYPNGVRGSQIKCKLKNTNAYITYSCSVYRGGVYIGYGSITLQNSKNVVNTNYYITITNGSQVFQYDESGIAPNSERQKNPIEVLDLVAVFHSPQGIEVTPKKVRWVVPQSNTLIDVPTLGLETDSRTNEQYFVGDTYPLSIKDVYDNRCNNNQVIAVVTHADGKEYRQSSNLLFTKIGNIGTNGTDTVVKINELINVPRKECLTIIKQASASDKAFYNDVNDDGSHAGTSVDSAAVLEASLYTNNTPVAGYSTKWTIAGTQPKNTSITQSYHYDVETNSSNNTCTIKYGLNEGLLDTRIVRAETSLNGKRFYSFYGIPTIEYMPNYTYGSHPIGIMEDGTLKNILYDSNGTNPSYNESQGAHVELIDWAETGYLEWEVESGPRKNKTFVYENPNFLLARNSKSKTGSAQLKVDYDVENIQALILATQDVGKLCVEQASGSTKKYIQEFLADIEKIAIDNMLSVSKKITNLWNRLASFEKNAPDQSNVYIQTVYNEYNKLIKQMEDECSECQKINETSSSLYNKVQSIWEYEWPKVISKERLHVIDTRILTFSDLVNKYTYAYDHRSDDAVNASDAVQGIFDRASIFDNVFCGLLNEDQPEDKDGSIDKYYDEYIAADQTRDEWFHPILIEYSKVLAGYLTLLINETSDCFNTEDESPQKDLYGEIKNRYSSAFGDWSENIGGNIYAVLLSSKEIIANIYDNMRDLYQYYKALFSNVKKYQVVEDSKTLNAWSAILSGQRPNLLNQIYVIPNETFNGLYMNNNIVGTAFVKNNNQKKEVAKIYIPIIMTLNTFELAALNGWDGTSIDIADGHIMTPQIGAGVKDDTTNTFTGMVMGVIGNNADIDNDDDDDKIFKNKIKNVDKVGLMGYANGKQSVFIDAKTGKAYFGLPEDDNSTEEGTNEGRIELVPGGVSKIGNWKIGNRFLYNIIDGNYEKRKDNDSRAGSSKLLVPHDKHGIILSADQPYIHIKGEVYAEDNLAGINYNDEYNDINPGDSLELRLDPGNKSLFSIVQHTVGFGDDDDDTLFFGYAISDDENSIERVKNYESNKMATDEKTIENGAEYYLYSPVLRKGTKEHVPYYVETKETTEENLGLTKIINEDSWSTQAREIHQQSIFLNSVLDWGKFQKTAGTEPVFTINSNTGVMTYNPNNLVWVNGNKGFSNGEGWQSATGKVTSANSFTVKFSYNKNINEPIEKDLYIGKFKNDTEYSIYKMSLNYTMRYNYINMSLRNSNNHYIQFYVVDMLSKTINDALLKSDQIPIQADFKDSNIELLSVRNNDSDGKLVKDQTYYVKMDVHINNYTVTADYDYTIKSKVSQYKAPQSPPYGAIEIKAQPQTSDAVNFTTKGGSNSLSGSYEIYTESGERRIRFKINDVTTPYDFVIWRKGNDSVSGGGQIIVNDYAKIFTSEPTELSQLANYLVLDASPTANNPWYISFYPKNSYTAETYIYNDTTIVKYKINTVPMIIQKTYSLNLGNKDTYDSVLVFWEIILNNLNFGDIKGFIPWDLTTLCIENNNKLGGIQGIPYAKTFWENGAQQVTFYKDYYEWVNSQQKPHYGYINISDNGGTYYKYIKTLSSSKVNDWFTKENLPTKDFSGGEFKYGVREWVTAPVSADAFKEAALWKEFIRVGLDENGRLFSSGIQDKKTYSRTGRIYSFGINQRFYGQELRVQPDKSNYMPILKIFTNFPINNNKENENSDSNEENKNSSSQSNITYITRGEKDDGNINIKTTNKGYIELGTSAGVSTENGGIPENTNYFKIGQIGQNIGAQVQVGDDKNDIIPSTINLNDKNGLSISTFKVEISASSRSNKNDSETDENNSKTIHYIDDKYSWTRTNSYIISSIPADTPTDARTRNLFLKSTEEQTSTGEQTSEEGQALEEKPTPQYYRMVMEHDRYNDNKPIVSLQVGQNQAGFTIEPTKVVIDGGNSNGLTIDNAEGNRSIVLTTTGNLVLDAQDSSIALRDSRDTFIRINGEEKDGSYRGFITLSSRLGGNISVDEKVTVKGSRGFVVQQGPGLFENNLESTSIYASENLHVGYSTSKNSAKAGCIYLYKDDNKNYVRILPKDLEQLFDWYNEKRWAIGCNGNTVWFRNIKNIDNPEGSYNSSKRVYEWNNLLKFTSMYTGQRR